MQVGLFKNVYIFPEMLNGVQEPNVIEYLVELSTLAVSYPVTVAITIVFGVSATVVVNVVCCITVSDLSRS